jgi:hypothetical protein
MLSSLWRGSSGELGDARPLLRWRLVSCWIAHRKPTASSSDTSTDANTNSPTAATSSNTATTTTTATANSTAPANSMTTTAKSTAKASANRTTTTTTTTDTNTRAAAKRGAIVDRVGRRCGTSCCVGQPQRGRHGSLSDARVKQALAVLLRQRLIQLASIPLVQRHDLVHVVQPLLIVLLLVEGGPVAIIMERRVGKQSEQTARRQSLHAHRTTCARARVRRQDMRTSSSAFCLVCHQDTELERGHATQFCTVTRLAFFFKRHH